MIIQFHGHSCVQISEGGHSLIIDPFISGNPLSVTKPEDVKVDAVLLTHGHNDHILDAPAIAKANRAPIVATFELANIMNWRGAETIEINLGGTVKLGFAEAQLVQAFHSSSVMIEEEQRIVYAGMPGGYMIRWNGKTIYHAGDTALFSDMKMFGELHDIDLALLPIGDHYTMGPQEAAIAAEWTRAKQVVPIHHGTFPPIKQDTDSFLQMLKERGIAGTVLAPGETMEI